MPLSCYWTRNLHCYEQDWRTGQWKNLETKITFQKMKPCDKTLRECFMTMKWQDILGNWKHTTLSDNITGGQVYIPLSRTTYRDVEHVSSLKSTDTLQNWHFYLQKAKSTRPFANCSMDLITDRGPQFALKAFRELMKQLGINLALSTAYHPQMDGTTEWVNQEIKAYLSIYCTSHLEEWSTALHTLEFTHNNRRHAERQKTPLIC